MISRINLSTKEGFMSLKIGDIFFKNCPQGEGFLVLDSWVVVSDAEKPGDIPKVLIRLEKPEDSEKFFIHLHVNQKRIIDDQNEIFFDFNQTDEILLLQEQEQYEEV